MLQEGSLSSAPLTQISDKQRQVLDLVIQHKSSKEIARVLGISPHTVDQRINLARQKFGVASRSELAVAYRQQIEACGGLIYQTSPLDFAPAFPDDEQRDEGGTATFHRSDAATVQRLAPWEILDRPDFIQETLDGPNATLWRLVAILGLAGGMLIAALVGLSVFRTLSEVLSGI